MTQIYTETNISNDKERNHQERTLKQIKNNSDLVLITSYANHSLYYQTAAFCETSDLTLVILPSSAAINREIATFKGTEAEPKVAALASDLFPNQARHLIAEVAQGHYKILFLTPESFLYWFSSGFNSMAIEHYRKLEESDMGKQVFVNTQKSLIRVSRIVFCEFELFSKTNPAFKNKYQEAISLIRELQKPILGLSFNCSKETIQHFLRFFPNTAVIQESLKLKNVSLKAKYCFSKLDKQKLLLKLLEEDSPTLVYVSQAESLSDLVNLVRKKMPNKIVRAFHKDLPPEQKADVLDYFLNDPCPTFLTSSDLLEKIYRPNMKRLIHYSPPTSLSEFYRELHIFSSNSESSQTSESYLMLCEDDFLPTATEKARVQNSYNKDGFQVDFKKQYKQMLDWISLNKGCRWQNLEHVLTSNLLENHKCGICDLCLGNKTSLFSSMSMFMLKNKLK
ncbi:MAG: hypothetical protein SFU25_06685 [Candidatus Caenarcaniphilales bacterium]|nr:hypothetical protein [Candidatus Caenarcaniphilales bacterium]